jgi:hypothetical protein
MKFSSDPEKATFPSKKVVYRIWTKAGERAAFDVLALEGEEIHLGENTFLHLHMKEVKDVIVRVERLNNPLSISEGKTKLAESKKYLQECLKELPESIFKLHHAEKYRVLLSRGFYESWQKTMSNQGKSE